MHTASYSQRGALTFEHWCPHSVVSYLPFASVDCWLVKNTSGGGCDGSGATSVGEHCKRVSNLSEYLFALQLERCSGIVCKVHVQCIMKTMVFNECGILLSVCNRMPANVRTTREAFMRDRRPRRLGGAPDAAGCSLGAALEVPLPPCASAAVCRAAVTEQSRRQCLERAVRICSINDCRRQIS